MVTALYDVAMINNLKKKWRRIIELNKLQRTGKGKERQSKYIILINKKLMLCCKSEIKSKQYLELLIYLYSCVLNWIKSNQIETRMLLFLFLMSFFSWDWSSSNVVINMEYKNRNGVHKHATFLKICLAIRILLLVVATSTIWELRVSFSSI